MARFRDEDVRMALNKCAARAGYSLRPLQEQVISFVQGSDVFVGLPTGSGKSLCYNILPDVFNSLRKVKSSIDERPGTGSDFLSDVHFSDFVTLRNVRWTYCACAMIGQYGAVVWLSLLTEPRTRCRCSASNFPLSMTPSSSCPYLCLFSRPCSSSVAVQA